MTTHRKPGDVASTPEGRALLTERADGTAPAWITEQGVEPAASKPVEPVEVGSVVTDTTGHVWARTSWDMWQCLSQPDVEPATWDQLDVTPEQP